MINNQEFRNYLAAGIVCQSLWPGVEEKTPIAYSYNGIVLPKLPEWDKSQYPYALITRSGLSSSYSYWLWVMPTPFVGTTKQFTHTSALKSLKDWNSDSWADFSDTADGTRYESVVWTSHDLYSYDGQLSLSASDPIPVYE